LVYACLERWQQCVRNGVRRINASLNSLFVERMEEDKETKRMTENKKEARDENTK
jgi:hypothetical protein